MKITKCAKKREWEETTTKTTTKARKFQNGNEQSQKITIGISIIKQPNQNDILWNYDDLIWFRFVWCDVMWFKHI